MENKRILVVDDEPMIVRVLTTQLQDLGAVVQGAGSAEEALLMAGANRYDLILLDINLPGASGFSVITILKEMTQAAIWVMTGHADEGMRKDAMLLGASGLIAKPFDLRQILSAIGQP